MKFSQLSVLIFGGLVILSYFLPWARLAPESVGRNLGGLLEKLHQSDEEGNFVQNYILMREREWNDMWRAPAEGMSGYQLFVVTSDGKGRGATLARAWMSMLFGSKEAPIRVKLLIIGPVLGLLAMVVMFLKKPPRWFVWVVSAGCFLYYALVRMKLSDAYGDRLLLHVEISYGLWLTLYGLLILAILVAVKGFLPARSKW